MLQRFVSAIALIALCSCNNGTGPIDGPYRLEITDIPEDAMLCYELDDSICAGRVPETVFAVGSNKNYIVAARHPHSFEDTSLDRKHTEYYYIIRSADGPSADTSRTVKGPLDKPSFEREKERLGLPEFTREISSLR